MRRAVWFDGQADQFDDTAGLAPAIGQRIARAIMDLCGCTRDDVVLDVGAGTGAIGSHFATLPARYFGVDRSLPMLEVFRNKLEAPPPHMLLLQGDSDRAWPIRDHVLTAVFASRVVHHLSPVHVVREVWRTCQPGGWLLLGRVARPRGSLPSRLQRQKRALLAEHGVRPAAGADAIQHLVAICCEHGASLLPTSTVAQWTRTTTARQIVSNWEGKPQLMSRDQPHHLTAADRRLIVKNLTDWARQDVEDLDRPEEFVEEYLLHAVKLP